MRSNRLVLLVGVFLAIVAFVGIVLIFQGNRGSGTAQPAAPTQLPTVFANQAIPLGTEITESMLRVADTSVNERDTTAFNSPSLLLGKVARKDIAEGKQLTAEDFDTGALLTTVDCPDGLRCMAVQVDQVSGVGTILRSGDYVDVIVAITGDKFPIITIDEETGDPTVLAGINPTTAKVLIQGAQVVGHILPPPPAPAEGQTTEPGTALTGQQEIVILALEAQDAEVVKFAQLDGSISLVLRSPADFRDANNQPIVPEDAVTSGITLRVLVDDFDVLIPQLIPLEVPEDQIP